MSSQCHHERTITIYDVLDSCLNSVAFKEYIDSLKSLADKDLQSSYYGRGRHKFVEIVRRKTINNPLTMEQFKNMVNKKLKENITRSIVGFGAMIILLISFIIAVLKGTVQGNVIIGIVMCSLMFLFFVAMLGFTLKCTIQKKRKLHSDEKYATSGYNTYLDLYNIAKTLNSMMKQS
jgi:hypothetical protein